MKYYSTGKHILNNVKEKSESEREREREKANIETMKIDNEFIDIIYYII